MAYWLAWEEPRAVGDLAHVEKFADARPDIATALAHIAALDLDPPPRILITGSLYLAGEVLAANGTPPT
jgi:folylpolyglutamate synthase/dihydropteroate synthase